MELQTDPGVTDRDRECTEPKLLQQLIELIDSEAETEGQGT